MLTLVTYAIVPECIIGAVLSELCWGKGEGRCGLYKAPTKEERRGRLRGVGYQIRFIDLIFE